MSDPIVIIEPPVPLNIKGHIRRVHMDDVACYILLQNENGVPLQGTFQLLRTHPGFNAMYSLVLSAAANRYVINLGGPDPISPGGFTKVISAFVDW